MTIVPGGLTFQAPLPWLIGISAYPPLWGSRLRAGDGYRMGRSHPESPVTRGWRAGTAQLRLSRRGRACCTLSRPPPPIRTYERLRRRPSWIEARALSMRIFERG